MWPALPIFNILQLFTAKLDKWVCSMKLFSYYDTFFIEQERKMKTFLHNIHKELILRYRLRVKMWETDQDHCHQLNMMQMKVYIILFCGINIIQFEAQIYGCLESLLVANDLLMWTASFFLSFFFFYEFIWNTPRWSKHVLFAVLFVLWVLYPPITYSNSLNRHIR